MLCLGNKKKSIYFVFRSAYTNFASPMIYDWLLALKLLPY